MCELIPVDWHFTGGFRLRNDLVLLYKVPCISYVWFGSWFRKSLRLLICWTSWADSLAGRQHTDIIVLLLSLEGCRKCKQYSHEERAGTTHPCPFEWKLTPASDLDKCSSFNKIDTPKWFWRYQNGSLLKVARPYQSPQKETDPFAPALNLPQILLHPPRENPGYRADLYLCTSYALHVYEHLLM